MIFFILLGCFVPTPFRFGFGFWRWLSRLTLDRLSRSIKLLELPLLPSQCITHVQVEVIHNHFLLAHVLLHFMYFAKNGVTGHLGFCCDFCFLSLHFSLDVLELRFVQPFTNNVQLSVLLGSVLLAPADHEAGFYRFAGAPG